MKSTLYFLKFSLNTEFPEISSFNAKFQFIINCFHRVLSYQQYNVNPPLAAGAHTFFTMGNYFLNCIIYSNFKWNKETTLWLEIILNLSIIFYIFKIKHKFRLFVEQLTRILFPRSLFPSVCSRFLQATSLEFQHNERLVDIRSSSYTISRLRSRLTTYSKILQYSE